MTRQFRYSKMAFLWVWFALCFSRIWDDAEKKVAINIISKYLFMGNHHQYSDEHDDHADDVVHR